jgi:hypothetical protein
VRIHTASCTDKRPLERWASQQARDTRLGWREWLFGAMGSVVSAHALIALAADEHATPEQASTLDDTYLELCVLTTALDHLVDYERDATTGEPSYIHLYNTREELAQQIALIVNRVKQRARTIPNGAHHLMILSGVVAYYTSQPSAASHHARAKSAAAGDHSDARNAIRMASREATQSPSASATTHARERAGVGVKLSSAALDNGVSQV